MSRRATAHVTLGDNALRCLNCGDEYQISMPCSVEMFAAMCKAFESDHKHCEPSDSGRARVDTKDVKQWRDSWDTGISSIALYDFFTRGIVPKRDEIPYDPADFGRCYRLLKIAPDWRARLTELAAVSAEWSPLVATWSEMERLYEEELPSGSAPKLYALMKQLYRLIPRSVGTE